MGNGQQHQLHEDIKRKIHRGKTRQDRVREEKGREREIACKCLCFSSKVEVYFRKQMLSLKSCVY